LGLALANTSVAHLAQAVSQLLRAGKAEDLSHPGCAFQTACPIAKRFRSAKRSQHGQGGAPLHRGALRVKDGAVAG